MDTEKLLAGLFGLQHFEAEPELQSLIDETGKRYSFGALSDDVMSTLSAAGDQYVRIARPGKRKKDNE